MPTKDELLGIVKLGVSYPTIDTTYFPNTVSSLFWSSSPSAYNSGYAWGVYFYSGNSFSSSKGNNGLVRLVRG